MVTVCAGEKFSYRGQVESSTCSIENVPVEVFIDGEYKGVVYTDSEGSWCAGIVLSSPGTYTLRAEAPGGTSCSREVTVEDCSAQQVDIYFAWSQVTLVPPNSIYVGHVEVDGAVVADSQGSETENNFTPQSWVPYYEADIKDELDQLLYSEAERDRIYDHLLRMARELTCGLEAPPWGGVELPDLQCGSWESCSEDPPNCYCCEDRSPCDMGFSGPCDCGTVNLQECLDGTWTRTDTVTL